MRVIQVLVLGTFLISTSLSALSLDDNDQQRIVDHFNSYVDEGKIPNVSILVKQDNNEIFRHVYGYADVASKKPADKKTLEKILNTETVEFEDIT